jgi:hypothetical protein
VNPHHRARRLSGSGRGRRAGWPSRRRDLCGHRRRGRTRPMRGSAIRPPSCTSQRRAPVRLAAWLRDVNFPGRLVGNPVLIQAPMRGLFRGRRRGACCVVPLQGGIHSSQCRPSGRWRSRPPAAVTNQRGATHATKVSRDGPRTNAETAGTARPAASPPARPDAADSVSEPLAGAARPRPAEHLAGRRLGLGRRDGGSTRAGAVRVKQSAGRRRPGGEHEVSSAT